MTNPQEEPAPQDREAPIPETDREKLIRQIVDRVWKLWQQDLRRNRERVGTKRGER